MKHPFLILTLLLLPVSVSAAVYEIQWTPMVSGELQTIDLGGPVVSIGPCTIRFVGSTQPKVVSCDSPGGQAVYYEPYYFSGGFIEGQVAMGSSFNFYPANEFDLQYTFTTEDWSFLASDGISELGISWNRVSGGGYGGFCVTQSPGFFQFDTVVLTIQYDEAVPSQASTWGAIKSIYR